MKNNNNSVPTENNHFTRQSGHIYITIIDQLYLVLTVWEAMSPAVKQDLKDGKGILYPQQIFLII
uniref:Transposase n=1 Tax=Romanomermis culicivorax TaxID=13658 RepID=A0A915I247_ROMCU